jgi:hypothetical protein
MDRTVQAGGRIVALHRMYVHSFGVSQQDTTASWNMNGYSMSLGSTEMVHEGFLVLGNLLTGDMSRVVRGRLE